MDTKQIIKKLSKTKPNGQDDIQDFMDFHGFKDASRGSFARVYANKNSDIVFKISYEVDYCWPRFARWVMRNKFPSKHLPKIYSFQHINIGGEKHFVSTMEKLIDKEFHYDDIMLWPGRAKSISELYLAMFLLEDADYFLYNKTLVRSLAQSRLRNLPQFQGLTTHAMIEKIHKNLKRTKLYHTLRNVNENLYKCVENECFIDLHTGNFMSRKDGTVVIIDPIAPL
jgi:hypothetical protein